MTETELAGKIMFARRALFAVLFVPMPAVLPAVGLVRDDDPVTASTAILLCVRNELPVRTIRNLAPMLEGLCVSGYAERFHLYILSDTSDPEFAVKEEAQFSELIAAWRDRSTLERWAAAADLQGEPESVDGVYALFEPVRPPGLDSATLDRLLSACSQYPAAGP